MRNGWFSSGISRVVCAAALSGAWIAACSASGDNTEFGNSSGPNGSGAGAGNPGGQGGDGGGFIPAGAGGSGNAGAGGGDSCAATKNKAQQVPLDMYIMFDQSSSMADNSKWTSTKAALKAFVEQPAAAGIGVGIQYFPQSSGVVCPLIPFCNTDADCGPAACGPCAAPTPGFPIKTCSTAGGDSCNPSDYAVPDVPIAPLPAVGTTIINSLNSHSPSGSSTPTGPALQGAVDYAKQWATLNPTHTTVVVLATDGEPTGCTAAISSVDAAANAFNGVPSIKTFVIGVGDIASLNSVAAAGGTGSAIIVDGSQNATEEFLQAMNEIRGAALSCSYLIPQPPPGDDIDYNAINVEYTPESGISVVIPQVKSAADCPAAGLAWYYDVPGAPKQIIFCDATCTQVAKDTKAEIDVLVGCATIVK
ncbi:vWA domain-containing protein [Polyangium sp. y55x31]|uniref:vWA domain-containing protein n=1 Tax=Polyangium sp. y55x31 TaxID=3042688 RepID=UPI002482918E|nr:vWA domain-containing protein [Polyangium sp. y55x31]MDI1478017.1 vWA domain-containing protein [Polyangium sp. y55x31]